MNKNKRAPRKGVEITPYKGGRTERVNVRATPEIKQQLDQIAEQQGISAADVIERLIQGEWRRLMK